MNIVGAAAGQFFPLHSLVPLDQVIIKQQVELVEALTGFETKNKYVILNSLGQQLFFAGEDSNFFCRCCCGADRQFTMRIVDNFGNEVITIERPWKPCGKCNCLSCVPFFMQELTVYSGGLAIGMVHQQCSCLRENFIVKRPDGEPVLDVTGPLCSCDMCWDDTSEIRYYGSEQVIGQIRKKFSGFIKEMFTDADNFGVTFPMGLDVNMKACLIGVAFLIDFMLYENKDNNRNVF